MPIRGAPTSVVYDGIRRARQSVRCNQISQPVQIDSVARSVVSTEKRHQVRGLSRLVSPDQPSKATKSMSAVSNSDHGIGIQTSTYSDPSASERLSNANPTPSKAAVRPCRIEQQLSRESNKVSEIHQQAANIKMLRDNNASDSGTGPAHPKTSGGQEFRTRLASPGIKPTPLRLAVRREDDRRESGHQVSCQKRCRYTMALVVREGARMVERDADARRGAMRV
ncbi:hypothetical protein U1Q18_013255 [Sarracenia purpurea var. burkii]